MTKYDEQLKLKVVREYLAGTVGYQRVAELYSVPRKSLETWVKLYRAHGVDGLKKKFSHYSMQFRLEVIQRMRTDDL
ncbi:transposase, partial [Massilia sp. CMS3.1]|uniref:transposase n=1 Tax=Massilia sp. CMS3.1 TaxID=3373083 RepID=UPI003EE4D096